MLTSPPLPSTVLHCTPHFPTVNAGDPVVELPPPLKRQVEEVERKWGKGWSEVGKEVGREGQRGQPAGENDLRVCLGLASGHHWVAVGSPLDCRCVHDGRTHMKPASVARLAEKDVL